MDNIKKFLLLESDVLVKLVTSAMKQINFEKVQNETSNSFILKFDGADQIHIDEDWKYYREVYNRADEDWDYEFDSSNGPKFSGRYFGIHGESVEEIVSEITRVIVYSPLIMHLRERCERISMLITNYMMDRRYDNYVYILLTDSHANWGTNYSKLDSIELQSMFKKKYGDKKGAYACEEIDYFFGIHDGCIFEDQWEEELDMITPNDVRIYYFVLDLLKENIKSQISDQSALERISFILENYLVFGRPEYPHYK